MSDKIPKEFEISIVLLILIPALLYFRTVSFEYAIDDAIVITENHYTKQGLSGIPNLLNRDSFHGFYQDSKTRVEGGRYRPLSLITFAIEFEFFGLNPAISHAINVGLYILTGILIFLILQKLIAPKKEKISHVAFITSLLFVCHPIHTEVVANIKGRDEIMGLLFALISLYLTISAFLSFSIWKYILSGITFLFALFSKENAITFIAIIPIILFLFDDKKINKHWKNKLLIIIPAVVATLIFLIKRQSIIGAKSIAQSVYCEILNNPFCGMTWTESLPTVITSWAKYIYMLLIPKDLTHDYYPFSFEYQTWSSPIFLISFAVIIIILIPLILQFKNLTTSRNLLLSYAFLLIPFSVVANLFFNVGALMNERFLYFSSLGFCMMIVLLLKFLLEKNLKTPVILMILVTVGLYGFKSIDRSKDWRNDFTIAEADIQRSPNSIKCNTLYGGQLLEATDTMQDTSRIINYLNLSAHHLKKAIELHPQKSHYLAFNLLGNNYVKRKDYQKALNYYRTCLVIQAKPLVLGNVSYTFQESRKAKEFKTSIAAKELLIKYEPSNAEHYNDLAKICGQEMGQINVAAKWLEKGHAANPKHLPTIENLGVVYGLLNDYPSSIKYLSLAIDLRPNHAPNYMNIGLTYRNMGNEENAKKYLGLYQEMQESK